MEEIKLNKGRSKGTKETKWNIEPTEKCYRQNDFIEKRIAEQEQYSRRESAEKSLCPNYKGILGKCNSLLKKKYLTSFCTVNGKIKTIYGANNGNVASVVNHEADLEEIFGKDIVGQISVY